MARSSLLITLLSAALAGSFIYFARPISAFFVRNFFASHSRGGPEVASASAVSGKVYLRRAYQTEPSLVTDGTVLHNQDRVRVLAHSDVILNFASGYRIRLSAGTMAVVELYDSSVKNSPALLTINSGDFDLLASGPIGQLFISKNQQIFSPEAKPAEPTRVPVVNAAAPKSPKEEKAADGTVDAQKTGGEDSEPPLLSETAVTNVARKAAAVAPPSKRGDRLAAAATPADKLPTAEGQETLSSAYIESVLTEHAEDLRRCQMSSIRDNQDADGQILLSVTIDPNGRVNGVKVLQNKLKNDQLTNCVESVVERTQFKPYAGEPITVTYPVEFR